MIFWELQTVGPWRMWRNWRAKSLGGKACSLTQFTVKPMGAASVQFG
jgi:hypothetical protein